MLNTHLASNDEYMRKMAATMSIKFDKYWGDCNMLMSIASVFRSSLQNGVFEVHFSSTIQCCR